MKARQARKDGTDGAFNTKDPIFKQITPKIENSASTKGGGFSGKTGNNEHFNETSPKTNSTEQDFNYIDQNSVSALGLGSISADKLKTMADEGQIWMSDPGADYKFAVTWAPGWDANRYKQYGGAGTPSSAKISGNNSRTTDYQHCRASAKRCPNSNVGSKLGEGIRK